jgi:hypothetical protein
MELFEKTFVLAIPSILTRSTARRAAALVPEDATLVMFDFSSNNIMFRSGASELVRLTLAGKLRTAVVKGWDQIEELRVLHNALRKEDVLHQFTR